VFEDKNYEIETYKNKIKSLGTQIETLKNVGNKVCKRKKKKYIGLNKSVKIFHSITRCSKLKKKSLKTENASLTKKLRVIE
jgi:hypothetical protein